MNLGLTDVSLTTNGQLLPRYAQNIIDSGMKRINVSLDTLDREHFRAIARSGDLNTVLHGIELMQAGGLKVKINMVPMHHVNDDQILPLLDYALERGIELRFIELMNMGHLQASPAYQREFFSMESILERIASRYSFSRTDAPLIPRRYAMKSHKRAPLASLPTKASPFVETARACDCPLTALCTVVSPMRVHRIFGRCWHYQMNRPKPNCTKYFWVLWRTSKARIFRAK
jgi:cyclic pyranopterin phosphate synthase